MDIVALALLSYLLGSFPSGVFIGKKFYNIDIREHGSKSMGGTNAGRVLGKKAGFIVSAMDIGKLAIPTILARIYLGIDMAAIIGFFGMIGHSYPIFARFKGGKCVSVFMGTMLILDYRIAVLSLFLWFFFRYITNYVSVASIIVCINAAIVFKFLNPEYNMAFITMSLGALFVVYLHRTNIKRLLNGTENKVWPERGK